MPAERQQLLRQTSGAIGSLQDLLEIRVNGIFRNNLALEQFAVAGDHCEKVIEIVSNASGQAANRIHFCSLAQLGFQTPAFADIAK
jgi:hypothetical protein